MSTAVISSWPVRFALPKYVLIRRILEARLDREYAPGSKIPSESALCRGFGVSRITIQEALAQLEKAGEIRREQGRGTFYVGAPARLTEARPSELLESVLKYREGAYMDVLQHAAERATPKVAQRLRLPPGAPVVTLDRLAFVDHQPVAFTRRTCRSRSARSSRGIGNCSGTARWRRC
jgi:DNA-binding GntR family transcriptional regulator